MYSREMKFCPGCKNACPVGHFNCPMGKKYLDSYNASLEHEQVEKYSCSRAYDLVVLVNLDTGEEEHFKQVGMFRKLKAEMEGLDYFERSTYYLDHCVAPEDRAIFLELSDRENIVRAMEAGEEYAINYHVIYNGESASMETRFFPYKTSDPSRPHMTIKTVKRI